jgi:hypothetical protein
VRKKVKYSSTKKPIGEALTLLLVKGLNRVATSIEGVLNLLCFTVCSLTRRFAVVLMSRRTVFPRLVKLTRSLGLSLRGAAPALLWRTVGVILLILLLTRLR